MLPALRLAQEGYGWLSPEALEAVREATGFTPGYCQSVASFYDMFFLEPVGTHVIEVCTNISCALCGAGEVIQAFEEELGSSRRDDRRRRDHAAQGRVPGRLRLGAGRGGRRALPRELQARGRARPRGRRARARTGAADAWCAPPPEANVLSTSRASCATSRPTRPRRLRPAAPRDAELTGEQIVELGGSGLRGRGGAGFPTGRKASFLAEAPSATSSSTRTSRSPARSRTAS